MAIKKQPSNLKSQLDGIQLLERKVRLQKDQLLNKAFESTDPNVLVKANEMLQVNDREAGDRKSYIFDPNEFRSVSGFKDKPIAISYDTLRRISYVVPVIRAIINTRIDQVTSFCEMQRDKYSTGFIIRKKRGFFQEVDEKPNKEEISKINYIKDFILNCGSGMNFEADDFDEFTRKVLNDSLTFDQLSFEIIRDRRGKPVNFVAVDGSTIRKSDSYDDDARANFPAKDGYGLTRRNTYDVTFGAKKLVKGYYPSYVQLDMNVPVAQFYPWELCFGIRNPTTSIYSNGYGVGEIETLVNTITSLLWGDDYNRRFFSQGSSPKGFIKIKNTPVNGSGNIGNNKISEFKQKWQSMMAGVTNSHKTMILEADADWVDLQKTNRDMEFSNWIEFLIKICCAVWRIDPAEINFPLQGGAEQKSLFEGSNEARLKHSKDKGLRPLVKFYERKLNKYIVSQIDPQYELVFMGIEDIDPTKELENDVKQVTNFITVDEIRIKRGLKPLGKDKGGDIVLNSIWLQWYNADQQQQQQEQQQQGQEGDDGGQYGEMSNDPGGKQYADEQEEQYKEEDKNDDQDDVFGKAFNDYFTKLKKSA